MNIDNVFLDNLVLREIKQNKKFVSGSYAKEKSLFCEVVKIGDKVTIPLKEKDKVVINKFSGTEIEINNEILLFVKQHDILAKLK